MRVHLKGVKKVTAKLATGETKVYYYAWNGGPRLDGQPGSAEFVRSYTTAHQARKTPLQGTLFVLIYVDKGQDWGWGKLSALAWLLFCAIYLGRSITRS